MIASDTAEVMVSLMKGSANASGIRKYGYSGEIAGKTGTTNDNIDAWFVGTKPRLSMAIWIGFDDASYGMGKSGMGAEQTAPLWARIGKKIKDLQVVPEEKFNFLKATRLVVCRESGLFASDVCPDRVSELFTKEGRPMAPVDYLILCSKIKVDMRLICSKLLFINIITLISSIWYSIFSFYKINRFLPLVEIVGIDYNHLLINPDYSTLMKESIIHTTKLTG